MLLPVKAPIPSGNRGTPGWKQKAVFLKEESIDRAAARLKQQGDKTDFPNVMQALVEAWPQTPET
jgi:hypothetical protein